MTIDKALEAALLPCPFCGGTPILSKRGGSSEVDGYTTFHTVSCKSCHVEKYAHSKPYTGPSEEDAISSVTSAWNRRAPLSALPGEAEVVAWRWKMLKDKTWTYDPADWFVDKHKSNPEMVFDPLVTSRRFKPCRHAQRRRRGKGTIGKSCMTNEPPSWVNAPQKKKPQRPA